MTVANLTPAIQRFIELERKKTDIKRYFEELNEALEAVVAEVGVGTYFQDPSDGTVFKLLVPEGKFVHFERFGYHRTKRGDEKRGDLSMKEAQEAGFTLA
jgi:hypothetical protein